MAIISMRNCAVYDIGQTKYDHFKGEGFTWTFKTQGTKRSTLKAKLFVCFV